MPTCVMNGHEPRSPSTDAPARSSRTVEFDGETLDEQLHAAEWLGGRAGSASESELPQVRLLTSWSPADGRHAMSLSPTLVRALAGAGGTFWMDVYPYVD